MDALINSIDECTYLGSQVFVCLFVFPLEVRL